MLKPVGIGNSSTILQDPASGQTRTPQDPPAVSAEMERRRKAAREWGSGQSSFVPAAVPQEAPKPSPLPPQEPQNPPSEATVSKPEPASGELTAREWVLRYAADVKSQAQDFSATADAGKPAELQRVIKVEDTKLVSEAPGHRDYWPDLRTTPDNRIRYGKDLMEKNFLLSYADETSPFEAGVTFYANVPIQKSWGVPSLEQVNTDKTYYLNSPGGGGLFTNPLTGLPVTPHLQIPGRTDPLRIDLWVGAEGYAKSNYTFDFTRNLPFLGGAIDGLTQGTVRFDVKGVYWWNDRESGLLPYEISEIGTVYDPNTFEIDGFSKLSAKSKTSGLDWAGYFRYLTADVELWTPWAGLTQGTFIDYNPDVVDPLALPKAFGRALIHPTFAFGAYYEKKTGTNSPDLAHETFLEPARNNWGFLAINKDTGLFAQFGQERGTTKLSWGEAEFTRLGWSMPLKSLAHTVDDLFGTKMGEMLADDFEVDANGIPKAATDTLLWEASKLVLYTESKDYRDPAKDTLLLPPGASWTAGDVKGHSDGWGVALEVRTQEKPTGVEWLDAVIGDVRLVTGLQVLDLEVEGNEGLVNIFVPAGPGGQGGVVTQANSEDALPDPSGTWRAISFDVEKLIPLDVGGALRVGAYYDNRKLLGEIDAKINTIGVQLGYVTTPRFSRGALML